MATDVYFSTDDACESLSHESISEAVQAWWDDQPAEVVAAQDFIEVYQYRRVKIDTMQRIENLASRAIENALECLDEDFGNPDEGTEDTVPMREAARTFVRVLLAGYFVWNCERTNVHMVKVADHVEPEKSGDDDASD